jgi:hypothetical protein
VSAEEIGGIGGAEEGREECDEEHRLHGGCRQYSRRDAQTQ